MTKTVVPELTVYLGRYRLRFDDIGTSSGVKNLVFVRPDGKLGSNVGRRGSYVIDYSAGRFELRR